VIGFPPIVTPLLPECQYADFALRVIVAKLYPMEKSLFSPEQNELCRLLKQVRHGAGFSQTDLAERLGKPQSFVSRYETGQQRLDILQLRQVCLAVGISLTEFSQRLEGVLGDS